MSGTVPFTPLRLPSALRPVALPSASQIIWDKTCLVIGRGDYHWQHEPAWYAVRKGKKDHWAGDRKQTTIWAIPHRKSETGHGTQKPEQMHAPPHREQFLARPSGL
ncbi:hypothetical protein [Mesorhizobium sp.]|uniref:hypothetical protein n=1 Tax=Mesorhizobium sp. TaxID=1871066 RepID=UPI00257E00D8|nr:hypothetical protein [Mesorhizobium sp.]